MELETRLDRYLQDYPQAPREVILASRLLFRAAHLLEAHIDAALQPLGLVMRQYLALVIIKADAGTPIKPSALSVSLDATRTQVTRLLDGLEQAGWVQRQHSQADRRSLDLLLTDAGAQLLLQATPAVHAAYAQAWQVVSAEGLRPMIGGLARLNSSLGG
ncbi:Transcriptional repressor MprA [Andreprevotia sp. IGB-42]|uniref:MarR family winged helix-turn-helix transcriptional regulator n=1 Tax=Andreprevotia sp. IGB-42 TaxID=2497473 RepID=UPI001359B868|nr:MarR family transcriptional regulator [Andreprevotia sp. IGB-42]KAF0812973.1 Transcriptional repressor MprA [Andreprevotia sp. IGB-42]